jgi:hypothetical protein
MKRKLTVALAATALAVVPMSGAMADSHLGTLQVVTEAIDVPAADDAAQVVIVHGVPDLEVDILVNGEPADGLTGVNFTDIAVVDLPADTYEIAVAPAGTTDAAIGPVDVTVEDGVSYSIVAHLDEDGAPTATIEANVTDEGAGIQVFHTAAFGPVDILPTEATGLEGVTNGQTAFVATGAGDVEGVGVAAAGESEAALDLGTVTVPEDTSVLAYAIGALPDDAEDDADETEAPTHVDSGTGGLAASGLPVWAAGLMALGALGLAVPAVATARRRS